MIKNNFYDALEGFRGFAVLLVLISHFVIIISFPKLIFLNLGFLGVNLFFCLSGFLITEILIKSADEKDNSKTLKIFYIRRSLRIFPIFYLSILALSIFDVDGLKSQLIWTLTYSTNIASTWFGQEYNVIQHFWSLCVEEQFYLVWPVLIVFFRRNRLYLFLLAVFCSIFLKFCYVFFQLPNVHGFIHDSTPAAIDALAMGAVFAELKRRKKCFLDKVLKLSIIPVILLFVFWYFMFVHGEYSFFYNIFGRLIISIIALFLIGWCVFDMKNTFTKIMLFKPLRFLGKISYGVYIYHWIIYYLLSDSFNEIWDVYHVYLWKFGYQKWFFTFIVFTVLSVVLASVSFYIIEKPILNMKKKFT